MLHRQVAKWNKALVATALLLTQASSSSIKLNPLSIVVNINQCDPVENEAIFAPRQHFVFMKLIITDNTMTQNK